MKSLREAFWWGIIALAAIVALAMVGSPHAHAQMKLQCAPREAVVEVLKAQGKEAAVLAITDQQWLIEAWKGEDGNWALFLIDPKDPGYMCHVFSGGEWSEAIKPSF